MDRREGNTRLYEISKEQTLDTRLKNLQDRFICKALLSNNPIITKLRSEYMDFIGGRSLTYKTVLWNANMNDSIYSADDSLDSTVAQ